MKKKRIFDIIQIGNTEDLPSRAFDWFIVAVIILNILVMFLETFDLFAPFFSVLRMIEVVTAGIFCVEYVLRIWTADLLYPDRSPVKARLRFLRSFDGVVDLMTILPFFFLDGFIVFRMLRVVRILHLFRINAQYDSFQVITTVLFEKRNQILSSVFIIIVLMLSSSLCMYGAEHDAQPENFRNAFSGIWWSMSTLLTVGYGDIYPVTTVGKAMAICIAFLGVGVVAIPTGIISAGFVEQYTRLKKIGDNPNESELRFIKVTIDPDDPWCGKKISELKLSTDILVATVLREGKSLVPRGDLLLKQGDMLVLAAEHFHDDINITLKEISLKKNNPWVGVRIRDLAISRMTYIISVKRGGELMIPRGEMILQENDRLLLYTKEHLPDAHPVAMRQS